MELDPSRPRDGIASIMRSAGVHPSVVHAFLKTGLLVGECTPHTDAERQEWDVAVNEWYAQNTVGGTLTIELSKDQAYWLAYLLEGEVEIIADTADDTENPELERHRRQVYEDILSLLENE